MAGVHRDALDGLVAAVENLLRAVLCALSPLGTQVGIGEGGL